MHKLTIKRIYQQSNPDDDYRVLVDRLWPRGVSKGEANLDHWMREIAPSARVRKAFDHDPAKMALFKEQYLAELNQNPAADSYLQMIEEKLCCGNVTLLYSAKSEEYNQAAVLKDWTIAKLHL